MDRAHLFLEQFLKDEVPSEFTYAPAERGPELAENIRPTWTSPGSGGMSLGQLRDRIRQARELKKINDYAREQRLNREMMEMLDDYGGY